MFSSITNYNKNLRDHETNWYLRKIKTKDILVLEQQHNTYFLTVQTLNIQRLFNVYDTYTIGLHKIKNRYIPGDVFEVAVDVAAMN